MNDLTLKPRRPYILRAFYDWLVDNDLTPHIVVDATLPFVDVPNEFVKDGQIILNIAPAAVVDLELGNDSVTFSARFGGVPLTLNVPLYSIAAIYARENGAGTMFDQESVYESMLETLAVEAESVAKEASEEKNAEDQETQDEEKPKGRPTLTVVK